MNRTITGLNVAVTMTVTWLHMKAERGAARWTCGSLGVESLVWKWSLQNKKDSSSLICNFRWEGVKSLHLEPYAYFYLQSYWLLQCPVFLSSQKKHLKFTTFTRRREHIQVFKSLHLPPVYYRIDFKVHQWSLNVLVVLDRLIFQSYLYHMNPHEPWDPPTPVF